jgi:hypothetical protein
MAALRSEVQLECHRSSSKAFIKAMKTWYEFSEWKSTNNNRNIGPQTEAILLVFFNIPCFFSRTELEVFLGYKSPNHNVDGALTKMLKEKVLVKATNKVGTEVYYLGNFAACSHFNATKYRTWIPDQINTRNPSTFAQITDSELETKDKIQQEHPPTTSDKSHQHQTMVQKRVVSHHRQRKVNPIRKHPYSPPTKNLPKIPLMQPQKIKTAH